MSVQVRYYTDPACSWSWGAEPVLRKLFWEFEGELEFVWAMGGLARRYGRSYRDDDGRIGSGADCFADLMAHWLDVGAETGMPGDPRLWTEDPLSSTYPSCIAVEAASEQGWEAGYRYLRRVREALFCERRRLEETEALVAETEAAGLDVSRFEAALESSSALETFGAHMAEARDVPEQARAEKKVRRTEGKERVSFPSALFIGEDGSRHGVWGWQPLEAYREAALAAGAAQVNAAPLAPLDAIARFGRLATRELEVLAETDAPTTRAALWHLASESQVRPVPLLTGTMWEAA